MDSKIILASGIKLDKNYNNVVDYNIESMLILVNTYKQYEAINCNYIDYEKQTVKLNCDYSVAIGCNYMAFENPRHGNKWYFAFIDDVIYKAENSCEVKFSIDVWSTFFTDWTAKPCFIVREHVNNDTIGLHTVPETTTTGDYVASAQETYAQYLINSKVVISSNTDPSGNKVYGGIYNGVQTGYRYYIYNIGDTQGIRTHIDNAQLHNGDINQLFIAPDFLAGSTVPQNHELADSNTPVRDYGKVNQITTLDGYTPKNKKLCTFPWAFYKLTNLQGQESILKQELWGNSTVTSPYDGASYTGMVLELMGCMTAGGSLRIYPLNYEHRSSVDCGINLAKYPQLNWSTDAYINWLTSQGVNQLTGTISNTMTNFPVTAKPTKEATEKMAGNIGSTSSDIGNFLASNYIAHITPPSVEGNMNSGDVMWARGYSTFGIIPMTIKSEFAKQIDDYFSRFGYKINETKTPNITGRKYWNYIEIGQEESIGFGSVPSKYMEIINNACRKGVTIWHVHDDIGDFNLNNIIV